MPTICVDGLRQYHEVHGDGVPVLMLHGGFCSLEVMRPQIDSLSRHCRVFSPEHPGHGRTPDATGPMSYAGSVANTLAYMDAIGLDDAHIVGFSDGAIIGLLLALDHPGRSRSLVAISANLHPSAYLGDEADWPHAQIYSPDRTRADHRRLSPDGPDHGDIVFEKVRTLWLTEPNIDIARLSGIGVPALIIAGDRDVIAPEHTRSIATAIPGGRRLCIVPNAGHGLMEDRADFVNFVVSEFLREGAR